MSGRIHNIKLEVERLTYGETIQMGAELWQAAGQGPTVNTLSPSVDEIAHMVHAWAMSRAPKEEVNNDPPPVEEHQGPPDPIAEYAERRLSGPPLDPIDIPNFLRHGRVV